MKAILLAYSQNGVLQPNTDFRFLDKLIKVNGMVNNFWIVDAELHFSGSEKKKLLHYLELCCSIIEPHLTKSALKDYQGFFEALSDKRIFS